MMDQKKEMIDIILDMMDQKKEIEILGSKGSLGGVSNCMAQHGVLRRRRPLGLHDKVSLVKD